MYRVFYVNFFDLPCYKAFETATKERKLLLQDIFGQKTAVANSKFIACLCEYLKYNW